MSSDQWDTSSYHSCLPDTSTWGGIKGGYWVMGERDTCEQTPADPLAALSAALAALKPNPSTVTLKLQVVIPDQYDEFKLLCESLNSWFHLQGVPVEP